jgi:molybdenum cofactor cytidylyltransferase
VQRATEAPADEIVVVIGDHETMVRQSLAGLPVAFVLNPAHHEGIGTSIAAGIRAVAGRTDGVLIMLGDQPTVKARTLGRICDAFRTGPDRIVGPDHQGVRGPPILFPAGLFPELALLEGDEGARTVLDRHAAEAEWLAVDSPYPGDVDTTQDLDRLASGLETGPGDPP